jgi:hypothetical protein
MGPGERFAGVGVVYDDIVVGGESKVEYGAGPREVRLFGRQWCPLGSEIIVVMLRRR